MKDHHVDRPGVEVGQPMKLTGSDRPIELKIQWSVVSGQRSVTAADTRTDTPCMEIILRLSAHRSLGQARGQSTRTLDSARLRMGWTTWWLWRGARTRSHPELGRENPLRQWYYVLRHGRVGRRQVFKGLFVFSSNVQHTDLTRGGAAR